MFETFTEEPLTAAAIQAVVVLLLIRFLDVWHREPLWLLGLAALWGATGAALLSILGNEAVSSALSPDVEAVWGAAISAPIVEELAKGLALLAIFVGSGWAGRRFGIMPFNGPTDGIVYGAAVGVGFAFAENNVYFLNATHVYGDPQAGLETLEVREGFLSLGILGHAVYTAAFGAGLGLATWTSSRALRVLYPAMGLAFGMLFHAFNNGFASLVLVSDYGFDAVAAWNLEGVPTELASRMESTSESAWQVVDIVGYVLIAGLFVGLLYWVRYEWRVLAFELHEEEQAGLISAEEYATLTAFGGRTRWYWQLLTAGELAQLKNLRAYHAQLAELAFAKWRARAEGWDPSHLDVIRRRVAGLRTAMAGG